MKKKIIVHQINSVMRLVPFLEFEEQHQQELIKNFGYPYELQRKGSSKNGKIYLEKDNRTTPFAIENLLPRREIQNESAEINRELAFETLLIQGKSHLFVGNTQCQFCTHQYSDQASRYRTRIGAQSMSRSRICEAMQYFEESELKVHDSYSGSHLDNKLSKR